MSPEQAYYRQANHDLLSLMLEYSTKDRPILEVGCGAGKLAEAYRSASSRKDQTYVGVELNEEVADEAKTSISKVIVGSIEAEDIFRQVSLQNYQLFVFGDVLEHLYDPWKTLKQLHTCADQDAHVVACIPNVQNWAVIKTLISGKWPYMDGGILDRTHIRFFTLDSAIDLFQSSGWKVRQVRGRRWGRDGREFFDSMRSAVVNLGLDVTQFERNASFEQFLIVAQRAPGEGAEAA